jgi:hypothetical protein
MLPPSVVDSLTLDELLLQKQYHYDLSTCLAYTRRLRQLAAEQAEILTDSIVKRRKDAVKARQDYERSRGVVLNYTVESSESPDWEMKESPQVVTNETLTEMAPPSEEETAGTSSAEIHDGQGTVYDLDDFFARPVAIADINIPVGLTFSAQYPAYQMWSSNPAVRAKLSNYAYFRGDLVLRISLSATPFHYGSFLFSWQPFWMKNDILMAYVNQLTLGRNVMPVMNTYLSQSSGVMMAKIGDNTPLVMRIPFFSFKHKANLFNYSNSVITNSVPFLDMEDLGALFMTPLTSVKVANTEVTSPVSVNIYAYMENVELGAPTSTDINITAEASNKPVGKKKKRSPIYGKGALLKRVQDTVEAGGTEYESPGPVQNVATAIAGLGKSMSTFPVVGTFATATASIAGTVAKFASFFGLSRPPVLTAPSYVYNSIFSNGWNVSASDTVRKLTADPKQELAIGQFGAEDPAIDELSIQGIASRESFLTSFTWNHGQSPGSKIWYSMVTPYQMKRHVVDATLLDNQFTQPTACAFAVAPFNYWRGTMRYRFEVICSKYHRGKLLIRFEPNLYQRSLIMSAPVRLNQQNAIIIDIQDTQSLTIDVEWAGDRPFCVTTDANITSVAPYFVSELPDANAAGTMAVTGWYGNGFIYVSVLNELVQPTASAAVEVNVFVSCPDLQVACNNSRGIYHTTKHRYIAQSSDVAINTSDASDDNVYLEHFGERVVSFRALLKRYQTTYRKLYTDTDVPAAGMQLRLSASRYPYMANEYKQVADNVSTDYGFDDWPENLFNYLRYAYVGVRGGYRHRVSVNTDADVSYVGVTNPMMNYCNPEPGASFTKYGASLNLAAVSVPTSSFGQGMTAYDMAIGSGALRLHVPSNGGVEFEVPFYSTKLFEFSFSNGPTVVPQEQVGQDPSNYCYAVHHDVSTLETAQKFNVNVDSCSGEDFNFIRFQGAPFIVRRL